MDYEEEELIKLAKEGDKVAFSKLIRKYQSLVFNLLYRLIPDEFDINDIAQDIWIKVYQSIANFKINSSFKTWLNKIAINTYYDKLRKKRYKEEVSIDEEDEEGNKIFDIPDSRLIPEDIILDNEWQNFLEDKIKSLPEIYKVIIIMREFQNLSYEEISNVMNISIGTVKSRLARAREMLIKELSEYFKELKK
ncbi:MAG: RNA polymerase sigma factor RpoE [Candidatus Sericytochromatia bacterium]|nr:MAG: RNA polymerase sigma factor RpoE [Candidatus Sericytochromatia bacterium]